jgi:hypothetical protein
MKPHSLLSTLASAFAVGALSACTTGPEVKSDAAPGANFGAYKSYEWIYQAPPQGMNPVMYERIRAAIDSSLISKGYQQGKPGDIAVVFTVGARDKVRVTDWGPYPYYGYGYGRWGGAWAGPSTTVDQYTEGTLAVDVYDVKTKQPVWHGVATDRINDNGADVTQVNTAVSAVMAQFPPA